MKRQNPINNLNILFKPKTTIKLPTNAIIIITRIFGFFRGPGKRRKKGVFRGFPGKRQNGDFSRFPSDSGQSANRVQNDPLRKTLPSEATLPPFNRQGSDHPSGATWGVNVHPSEATSLRVDLSGSLYTGVGIPWLLSSWSRIERQYVAGIPTRRALATDGPNGGADER